MYKYKVSIVIPIYNSEKYLEQCLKSIIKQTMPIEDIQVILINDGSSDNSPKIIKKYVDKYESVITVNRESPSGGAAIPRNIGMEHVESKYVIFIDSDDMIEENFCEILFNQIESENSNIVACNFMPFYDENFFVKKDIEINKLSLNPLEYEIDNYNIPFPVWGKIFNTDFIKKNNIKFIDTLWDDLLFSVFSFYYNANEITYLSNYPGYLYNKIDWGNTHSSSTASKSVDGLLERIQALNLVVEFSLQMNENVFNNFFKYLIKWHLYNLLENQLSNEDSKKYIIELSNIKIINKIRLPFIYSFVNYFVINRNFLIINLLRKFRFHYVLYGFDYLHLKFK